MVYFIVVYHNTFFPVLYCVKQGYIAISNRAVVAGPVLQTLLLVTDYLMIFLEIFETPPDMEFVTKFTRTRVLENKKITQKFGLKYNCLWKEEIIFCPYVTLIWFYAHIYTNVSQFLLPWTKKYDNKRVISRIYNKLRVLKAIFYPRRVKFYTDNVRVSVTYSMSERRHPKTLSARKLKL